MKAKPVKLIYAVGYEECSIEEATHVTLNIPGPTGELTLPIMLKGAREGTGNWSWNGDTEKPTLKPSVLTNAPNRFVCHSIINEGKVQFLPDCSHDLAGQTVELLEVI